MVLGGATVWLVGDGDVGSAKKKGKKEWYASVGLFVRGWLLHGYACCSCCPEDAKHEYWNEEDVCGTDGEAVFIG